MKKLYLFLFLLICIHMAYGQVAAPDNDDCDKALDLPVQKDFCSEDGEYTNVGSEDGYVWFKVTAVAYNLFITVNGAGSGGTILSPDVDVTTNCASTTYISGKTVNSGNITTVNITGLIIGQHYLIRVGSASAGTFKLCFKNVDPIPAPGQDYPGAALLCNKDGFAQGILTGPGTNPNEAAGTCLDADHGRQNTERNSAWYKWTAATSGTLVFTISPNYQDARGVWDDIDWVLYDLGPAGDAANVSASNAIRCAAGHGVENKDCPSEPLYYKTGLDFNSTDTREESGCGGDGKVKYIDMIAGHVYALLVNNFTPGENGFTVDFTDQKGKSGTGEFVGPKAIMEMAVTNPCLPDQSYQFRSLTTGAASIKWNFGDGASIATSTDSEPPVITYSTLGKKTVILEAFDMGVCHTVDIRSFFVALKPALPPINLNKEIFCTGDIMKFSTPLIKGATYQWAGPNNFSSKLREPQIPVDRLDLAGTYSLTITVDGCTSDVSSRVVAEIIKTPTAAFTTDIPIPAKLSLPVTVNFTNNSVGADAYLWDFGDGETSTDIDPQHIYTKIGDYTVSLTAFNKNVCTASVSLGKLVAREGSAIFIPNTFTPNNDGINDEFVITIIDLRSYHIKIFNRYGEELFESDSVFDNWKGTFKNEALPVGTYYYLIDAVDLKRNNIRRSGSVTIIR